MPLERHIAPGPHGDGLQGSFGSLAVKLNRDYIIVTKITKRSK